MTELEFSIATFADAIKRANIIAPTRGSELDKYKGFVFDLDPNEDGIVLRTTNGDIWYTEFLYPSSSSIDKPTSWRVSSLSLNAIISSLPIKNDARVNLKAEGGKMRITYGRMKATTPFIRSDDYPEWQTFDADHFETYTKFGEMLDRVGWATSNDNLPPRCGVYLSETVIAATREGVVVSVPSKFNFADGRDNIVIPYSQVAPIARTMEECKVGVVGNNLLLSPTEDVFIKCALYDDKFPNVEGVIERTDHDTVVMFSKSETSEVIKRVSALGADDRQRNLLVTIGDDLVIFAIRDSDSAEEVEETIMVPGQADHEPVRFLFSIELFRDAIEKAPGKDITLLYDPANAKRPVKFVGADDYNVVVMPRREVQKERSEG